MHYLVTGGAGFIGAHLVEALVTHGHRVRVLDDFSTGRRDHLRGVGASVEILRGSVTDPGLVRAALRDVEQVFHLAALPSVRRSVVDPVTCHEVCATGTLRVLEAARRAHVQRVVYAASSSAYGDLPEARRRESDPVSPQSPYAAAKLAGEYYCRSFTEVYGLETVRLRFFNVFGPRQDARSSYSGVVALFLAALAAGQRPTIYGDGLQSRDFTYVDNVVEALLQVSRAPTAVGKVYNIGMGESTTILRLVERLNVLIGSSLAPLHQAARRGDVLHSQADITLARRDLGYQPMISLDEGLGRTVAWLRGRCPPRVSCG